MRTVDQPPAPRNQPPVLDSPRLAAIAIAAALVLTSLGFASQVQAQAPEPTYVPPPATRASLGGPRFGITYLNEKTRTYLATEHQIDVQSVVSQFGWQFERQFYAPGAGGPVALTEWVLLVGGLDQGAFLPSLSWLVGLRTDGGAEIAVGPNLTPAGVALAIAGGVTSRMGGLNIPINVAVVPSKRGARVSLLTGFSMRGSGGR